MPAGEIRAAKVTNLPRTHHVIQRADRFLNRRDGIEGVELKQVNVIGAETLEGALDRIDQMMARGTDVIRSVTAAKGGLGGDENLVAPSHDGFAKDFLR